MSERTFVCVGEKDCATVSRAIEHERDDRAVGKHDATVYVMLRAATLFLGSVVSRSMRRK